MYIKMTYWYFIEASPQYIIQVSTYKGAACHHDPLQSWERTLFFQEVTLLASEGKEKVIFVVEWPLCL